MRRDHARALALVERDLVLRNRVAKYVRAVLVAARRFLEFAGSVPLRTLAGSDVEAFLAARVRAGVGASTPARDLGALVVFFEVLVRLEVIAESPTDGLFVHERPTPPQLLLSENVVGRLLGAALEEAPGARSRRPRWTRALALRDRACLELLYGVGVRDSEVRAVRVVDLDLAGGSLLVRSAKRGRWRRLPLPPAAVRHLEFYLREARPLLAVRGRDAGHLLLTKFGTPLSQSTSYGIVAQAARRAGVRAHPHAFRRALATHLIRGGVPVTAVQELLGHRNLATTAQYLSVEREDLRRTVDLLELPDCSAGSPSSSLARGSEAEDEGRPASGGEGRSGE